MKDYSNAFAEVYEILNHLEEEAYKKIPTSFLDIIKNNRNLDYEYIVYEDIELKDHEMLPETRAILFNIFRDYLSTPEQKEKIRKMQAEERRQNEEKKRKEYYSKKAQKEKIEKEEENDKEELIVKKEESAKEELIEIEPSNTLWEKVKGMLKRLLKR